MSTVGTSHREVATGTEQYLGSESADDPVGIALRGKKICFVVNVDWFFLSHRLPVALAAKEAGAIVTVAALDTGRGDDIRRRGLEFVPLDLSRGSMNPISEARLCAQLRALYRRIEPDIIHHVTLKPILLGSAAARSVGASAQIVNALSGMGYLFSGGKERSALSRFVYKWLCMTVRRWTDVLIVENRDDYTLFHSHGLRGGTDIIIAGPGVDLRAFSPLEEQGGDTTLVVFVGRQLWDKGVREFVEAARVTRQRLGPRVRFALVGPIDSGNRSAVPRETVEQWVRDGDVEWWGYREDIREVMQRATVVVLPSYREGLPRVLLEAGACTRPVVATDVPGCREPIEDGKTGLLVPRADSGALARAIERMIQSPPLRRQLALNLRHRVEREFSVELFVNKHLALYERLVGRSSLRERRLG